MKSRKPRLFGNLMIFGLILCGQILLLHILEKRGIRLEEQAAVKQIETHEPENLQEKPIIEMKTRVFLRELTEEQPTKIAEKGVQPKPMSSPKRQQPSVVITPDSGLVEKGLALMANDDANELPMINSDYRKYVGFNRYSQLMTSLGGKFAIMKRGSGEVFWELDLKNKRLVKPGDMARMSNQTRKISQEPGVKWAKVEARNLKPGVYDVVLIMPLKMAAYLTGGLELAVSGQGREIIDFRTFNGIYRMVGGRLTLDFGSGTLKSGVKEQLLVHLVL